MKQMQKNFLEPWYFYIFSFPFFFKNFLKRKVFFAVSVQKKYVKTTKKMFEYNLLL